MPSLTFPDSTQLWPRSTQVMTSAPPILSLRNSDPVAPDADAPATLSAEPATIA